MGDDSCETLDTNSEPPQTGRKCMLELMGKPRLIDTGLTSSEISHI